MLKEALILIKNQKKIAQCWELCPPDPYISPTPLHHSCCALNHKTTISRGIKVKVEQNKTKLCRVYTKGF